MAKVKTKPKRQPVPPPGLRLEWLDPETLAPNPANWRRHPEKQTTALRAALEEVGWAGALLYNERTKRLIDGHARKEIKKGGLAPVLIGSWTEEQERLILATLDPLAAMASADAVALQALLADVATGDEALKAMLAELAAANPALTGEVVDPAGEWQGMPEFVHEDKTAYKSIAVHFKDQTAVDNFAELVGKKVTPNTRYLWFPEIETESYADKRYVDGA